MPQQHQLDLNLAALDEHLSNEGFVAELERNTSSQVSTDSQERLHKKGKILQNARVSIFSSEAVMFSKQTRRDVSLSFLLNRGNRLILNMKDFAVLQFLK